MESQSPSLRDWISESGSNISKVAVKEIQEQNRIIVAKECIDKYGEIFRISKCKILDFGRIVRFFECKMDENEENFDYNAYKHSLFALFLLIKIRNRDPALKPYLDSLPKEIDFLYFEFVSKFEYETDYLYESCIKKLAKSREDFEYLRRVLKFENRVNIKLEEFLFCKMLVSSRLFNLTRKMDSFSAMVPFADMMNHDEEYNAVWKNDLKSGDFYLEAIEDISKEGEIKGFYGPKSNLHFMLNYGFCLSENSNNSIRLNFEIKNPDFATSNNEKGKREYLELKVLFKPQIKENLKEMGILRLLHSQELLLSWDRDQASVLKKGERKGIDLEEMKSLYPALMWDRTEFYSFSKCGEINLLKAILNQLEILEKQHSDFMGRNIFKENGCVRRYYGSQIQGIRELQESIGLCISLIVKDLANYKEVLKSFRYRSCRAYIREFVNLDLE